MTIVGSRLEKRINRYFYHCVHTGDTVSELIKKNKLVTVGEVKVALRRIQMEILHCVHNALLVSLSNK